MKNEYQKMDEYFRALNYLSVAQIYLKDNVLLKRPLTDADIKKKIVGHWGSCPGQNFIYTHLNRVINKYDLNMLYISGPGHSGNAQVAAAYFEDTYGEVYPDFTQDEAGLTKLCQHFSFPGGIGSHHTPEVPGSMHEGGELGHSLSHAFGAVLDNPDLIVAAVVGDGEAETGSLAGSWTATKVMNPLTDGVVLPILHLNGYKIANPTLLARTPDDELIKYFEGMGYKPYIVGGSNALKLHELMAKAMDEIITDIQNIKMHAKATNDQSRPVWPMLILKTPKGWQGIKTYADKPIEGTFRAHQVPVVVDNKVDNIEILEEWLKSYEVDSLFDENGKLVSYLKELNPKGQRRMSANPHTNGGLLTKELNLPDFTIHGLTFETPGSINGSDMSILGKYVRDIVVANEKNFRIFGPDEALSNKFNAVFEVTNRQFTAEIYDNDEFLAPYGRVIDSILSETLCEGMLEGYNLTGRWGFFHTYEAFVRIVDSMASQHSKWLKMASELPWRKPIPSLNFILTSHCWQQDHNGYTHQNPGFLNHMVTKKPGTVRMYLPCDANTLLACFNQMIGTKNLINILVASKHERPQWLGIEEAKKHCAKGIDVFKWASDENPDIVLASAGSEPTLEVLAATQFLKEHLPELKVRVVNVVDLSKLASSDKHPDGLSHDEYNALFTIDKPIVFAFHGYPDLIHQLTYNRDNLDLHVRGYIEEGTITTPFDMRVQNRIDRYHLVMDALKYSDLDQSITKPIIEKCQTILKQHHDYIREHGIDMPEVVNFQWKNK